MKTKYGPNSGLTLIEAMIVVAFLAVPIAIFLAAHGKTHRHNYQSYCRMNLKQIILSFEQWKLDNDGMLPTQVPTTSGGAMEWAQQGIAWPVFQVMSNEVNSPKILFCPLDSAKGRVMANTFRNPNPNSSWPQIPFTNNQNLSYFVGMEDHPFQTNLLRTGDSHFEVGGKALSPGLQELNSQSAIGWTAARHPKRTGNLGFADGSVRLVKNEELPAVFEATGLATNRLLLP